MDSFKVIAAGILAQDPNRLAEGATPYTRFCLIDNRCTRTGEQTEGTSNGTGVWFRSYGTVGLAIARNTRKGDSVTIEARDRAGNGGSTERSERQYDCSFIVHGFRFSFAGRIEREEAAANENDSRQ